MADSFVQLNNDGPGKKIDTRTESTNGDHRQVMVIGDPNTNANVANVTSAGAVQVDGSGVTQPISAASLPLPAGAATAANQSTAASTLSSILTNTPPTGQATMANSSPVVLASNQSSVPVNLSASIPTGTNQIGHVIADSGSTTVVSGNVTVVQPTGTNLHAVIDSGTVTLSGTSPVSGTVTANQGTPAAIGNRWPVQLTDGTNLTVVTAEGELTTANPEQELAQGSTTAGQTGPLIQGAVTTAAPTYTTAQTNPLSLTTAGALRTDASATTQPVSGTVTANAGSGTFNIQANASVNNNQVAGTAIATAAAGIQKVGIADSTGTSLTSTSNALDVNVKSTSGNLAANVTQYGSTNISTGTGASGAGIPRVTISNDSSLAANQSVNVNQYGGSATTLGQKAMAASQPVVIASDQSNLPTNTVQISGAAVVTAASGIQKVGIVGNTGAAVDAAGQNAASPANELLVAGQFNTSPTAISSGNISPLQLSSNGQLIVETRNPTIATYTASIGSLALAAAATDIFTITGSGTKTVKIKRVIMSATQTTAGSVVFVLLKRSTANSAGTSTAPTVVPHDSNNAAGTATILAYTANPTTGTLVGAMYQKKVLTETATSASDFQGWDLQVDPEVQPVVLRGTSQVFAVNLNGATVTGGNAAITITWTEE